MEVMRALALAALLAGALPAAAQSPADAADLATGREKYRLFCASCHGEKGDGKGPAARGLLPPPRDFTSGAFKYGGTDRDLFDVISDGAASKGGSPLMAAWSPVLQHESDRWALVKYIRSLKKR
jgi:mono/diheme cytochrome c family protein